MEGSECNNTSAGFDHFAPPAPRPHNSTSTHKHTHSQRESMAERRHKSQQRRRRKGNARYAKQGTTPKLSGSSVHTHLVGSVEKVVAVRDRYRRNSFRLVPRSLFLFLHARRGYMHRAKACKCFVASCVWSYTSHSLCPFPFVLFYWPLDGSHK